MVNLPDQRWHLFPAHPDAGALADRLGLPPLIGQILCNRDLSDPDLAQDFLNPEAIVLPSPLEEFPALATSVELLETTLRQNQKIAICGDYDADGMTSTALLLRALRYLGGQVNYAIPSRMQEGYGINNRIIDDFHKDGISLVLTVDNGIAAHEPIAHARALGLKVIITDHHDLPPVLPPANAILNPKLIPPTSPYAGLAGVGVAYMLAMSLAQQMGRAEIVPPLLELFTLGTIADLAPLTGVNRRWLRQGLARLPYSSIPGIQALIEASGITASANKSLKPEDIGFRLGPRINAIGRIGDPQVIINLLTADDLPTARIYAETCEAANQERQTLCQQIEEEALEICNTYPLDPQRTRVLVLLKDDWHHGVIGIVASRLVDRYGMPVFIATYEHSAGENPEDPAEPDNLADPDNLAEPSGPAIGEGAGEPIMIRGSARGIPEFNVFDALEFCKDLLHRHGGHKAAGGFSLPLANFVAFQQRLQQFGLETLEPKHLKPLLKLDAELQLSEINAELFQSIDTLHPWGIGNAEPVFWSQNVQISDQRPVGSNHLKLRVRVDDGSPKGATLGAIAWRWEPYFPLPKRLDIAYKLRQNTWNGQTNVELELLGARLPEVGAVEFSHADRTYSCRLDKGHSPHQLQIHNQQGDVLTVTQGQALATLQPQVGEMRTIDVREPFFKGLVQQAVRALDR
jgi:single-stranded-DNA-specific exonuclease